EHGEDAGELLAEKPRQPGGCLPRHAQDLRARSRGDAADAPLAGPVHAALGAVLDGRTPPARHPHQHSDDQQEREVADGSHVMLRLRRLLLSVRMTVTRPQNTGGGAPPPIAGAVELFSTARPSTSSRSEEHTSELQSRENLVCRL